MRHSFPSMGPLCTMASRMSCYGDIPPLMISFSQCNVATAAALAGSIRSPVLAVDPLDLCDAAQGVGTCEAVCINRVYFLAEWVVAQEYMVLDAVYKKPLKLISCYQLITGMYFQVS
jgi:hypothetical protein